LSQKQSQKNYLYRLLQSLTRNYCLFKKILHYLPLCIFLKLKEAGREDVYESYKKKFITIQNG
jgi:hypothetical protein